MDAFQAGKLLMRGLAGALIPIAAVWAVPDGSGQPDGLRTFVSRPEHQQAVSALAVDAFKKQQSCGDATAQPLDKPNRLAMAGPLTFDAKGALATGGINEPILVAGCDKQRVENVLTVIDKGLTKSFPGIPGTTLADPVLGHDSMQYIYLAAARQIGTCKSVMIVDSRFDAYDGEPNPTAKLQVRGGQPWRETWTLNACGTVIATSLHYIPDATGIAIQATPTPQAR